MDRRLIEETFPVKEVSKESSKEKSVRQGHISTLHTWWARRPLLASRAVCFASLIQFSSNKKKNDEHVEFIKKLSVWHMPDYDHTISKARKMVLNTNNSNFRAPKGFNVENNGSYKMKYIKGDSLHELRCGKIMDLTTNKSDIINAINCNKHSYNYFYKLI